MHPAGRHCPRTVGSGSALCLGPLPGPCVLWKGPLTFVRQRILFMPGCDRGGFTSPILSVCCPERTPQKQNVCFPVVRALGGPLATAATPFLFGQAVCHPGAWCRDSICHPVACRAPAERGHWVGRHSEDVLSSGPSRPVVMHSTWGVRPQDPRAAQAEPGGLTSVGPSFLPRRLQGASVRAWQETGCTQQLRSACVWTGCCSAGF